MAEPAQVPQTQAEGPAATTSPAPASAAPAPKLYSLDILKTTKTAQLQNGLRHGDYLRYRAFCTKRTRRIRKKLRFLHGRKFKKLQIDPAKITDVRYLELVLMEAERCWAHAMQLKEDVENPRAKFHARRRLAKGTLHAKELLRLCNEVADARTKLEAESYANWFIGSTLLEKEMWLEAKDHLVRAKTVYEELGKVGDVVHQELSRDRVAEIEPAIRYCTFSLSQQSNDHTSLLKMASQAQSDHHPALDMLRSKLDAVMADLRRKEAASVSEITWQGQKVPIKNENVRLAIVSANDIVSELQQSGTNTEAQLSLFDKLFIQYSDALKLLDSEIQNVKKTALTQQGKKKAEEELKSLESLSEYVTYSKLSQTMQRNLLLVEAAVTRFSEFEAKNGGLDQNLSGSKGKTTSPDEVARLYELLVSNVTEMNTLRNQNDHELGKVLAAKLLTFKALRCYYVGLTYAYAAVDNPQTAPAQFAESLALLNRCQEQIKTAIAHHNECKEVDDAMVTKLKAVEKQVGARKSLIHARGYALSLKKPDAAPASKDAGDVYLMDQLNEFKPATKLFEFPPKFEPITAKPLLYDLATDGLSDFPSIAERKKPPAPKAAAASTSTSSGFFASLWGSKK